ncbi:replication protein RepA [Escherichia coli]
MKTILFHSLNQHQNQFPATLRRGQPQNSLNDQ